MNPGSKFSNVGLILYKWKKGRMIYGRLETARLFYPTGNAVVQKNNSPSSDCTDFIEVV